MQGPEMMDISETNEAASMTSAGVGKYGTSSSKGSEAKKIRHHANGNRNLERGNHVQSMQHVESTWPSPYQPSTNVTAGPEPSVPHTHLLRSSRQLQQIVQPGAIAIAGPGGESTNYEEDEYTYSDQPSSQQQPEQEVHNHEDVLPIAGMVVEDHVQSGSHLPVATAKKDKWVISCFGRQIHGAFVIAAVLIVIVVAVAVPVVLTREGDSVALTSAPTSSPMPSVQPTISPSHLPTLHPSFSPSVSVMPSQNPTASPTSAFMLFVKDLVTPISGIEALENPTSPQHRALEWLVLEDELEKVFNQRLEQQLIQRYIVALIFFITGGETSWTQQLNFLSAVQECAWVGVSCDDTSVENINTVTGISLADNDLRGPIVKEWGSLPNLSIVFMDNNMLTGTIPDELVALTGLTWFAFAFNELSGTIPSALGDRDAMQRLALSANQFAGTVPTELLGMTSVESVRVDLNPNLSGDLNFLCDLPNIVELSADCGGDSPRINCTSSCCTFCCQESGVCCFSDGFCCVPNFFVCVPV